MPEEFKRELREAGARLLVFRPEIWRFRFRRDRWRRMPRKIAVADGRVAFVGEINITDDMDTRGQAPPRYDYAVQIEGPLVARVQEAAVRLWNRIAMARLEHGFRVSHPVPAHAASMGSQRAALVVRDNLRHRRDIEEAYLAAIGSAQQEIIIASAYFFPGRRFRRALVRAAARDVRVVLLLQGRLEYVLLHYASHALYGPLLEAGVEIDVYHQSLMHAKDSAIACPRARAGIPNIDPI